MHADGGIFVRRREMRHAALTESRADVFQHKPQAHIDIFQPLHLVVGHHAGIGVRENAM
jgi:hypothetical protein